MERVKRILNEAYGRTIGMANENPILDLIMYEVEYRDGYIVAMAANKLLRTY